VNGNLKVCDCHFLYISLPKLNNKLFEKMSNNEGKIWEKFYGKKVCSENLNIEGFKKPIPFDIYDGHAVCEDYKGHRFDMLYPQLKAVKDSKELSDAVIEYIGDITDKEEITVMHVLMAFNTLYKDGKEIKPTD
jgi:hypothetical protein